MNKKFSPLILLFLLSAIWGSSFAFIKIGVSSIPPLSMAALRLCIAGMFLWSYIKYKNIELPQAWKQWIPFLVISMFGNAIPFSLINWGETKIDSDLAAILIGTTPIFTIFLAHFLTEDERLSRKKIFGVFLGFLGIMTLTGIDTVQETNQNSLSQIAIIVSATSYAFAIVYARRIKKTSPLVITAASTIGAAYIMLIIAILFDNQWIFNIASHYPSLPSLVSVGFLGILNTALAGILFFYILQKNGAIFTAQCNFLIPIFGIFWGFLFLGETITIKSGLALAFILSGITVIQKTKIMIRGSKTKNKSY